MKVSELRDILTEIINEELKSSKEEGVGAGDPTKDPKHVPGDRWRVKFGSQSDLKKHGDSEMSPVSQKAEETISKNEIKNIIQEIFREEHGRKYKIYKTNQNFPKPEGVDLQKLKRLQSWIQWGKIYITTNCQKGVGAIYDRIIKEIDRLVGEEESKENLNRQKKLSNHRFSAGNQK